MLVLNELEALELLEVLKIRCHTLDVLEVQLLEVLKIRCDTLDVLEALEVLFAVIRSMCWRCSCWKC